MRPFIAIAGLLAAAYLLRHLAHRIARIWERR
ncbi:PGF-CTERM sorting domain-containing protein [Streptomyces sp. NPDC003832]